MGLEVNVTGKATVTLGSATYQFDVSSIMLGVGANEEPEEVKFVGADSKVWGVGTPQTSFTVPLESVSPEFKDLIMGTNSAQSIGMQNERFILHPDGSESWVEVAIDPITQAKKMRTVYASDWSNYMEATGEE